MPLSPSLSSADPGNALLDSQTPRTTRSRAFYNPHNTFCALWASAVETYLRGEHPDLTLGQIRQLPMMQGVFQHLRNLEKGIRQTPPEASAKTETDAVDQMALMSQDYLDLGMTIMLFSTVGNTLYEQFIQYLDDFNNNSIHPMRDYSTDDLVGFALCTIVYVGLTGSNLNNVENEFVQYMIDTLDISAENKQKIRNFWDNMTPNTAYSFQYRDASDSRYSHYGAIPWTVPSNAQIILLGDWGTSLDDAHQLLYNIWKTAYQTHSNRPIVFIHLGDIYYTGLPAECDQNFNQVFLTIGQQLHNELGGSFDPHPPIFTIPGNHEYYSYGYGYFQLLDTLNRNNASIPASQITQTCSFFCLRSEDNNWQFLGMDTGQDDYNGITAAMAAAGSTFGGWLSSHLPSWGWLDWVENLTNTLYQDFVGPFAPTLKQSELNWHVARLSEFERYGKTILFSHHQLFSRNAEIDHADPQYLNANLLQNFKYKFKDKIAAWFWGHEHSYAIYKDGIFGLNKGRLLGSSSYEATFDNDDPYANNYPMVPYADSMSPLPIGQNAAGLYNHAAAIMLLNGDHLTVTYYQFPAWNNIDAEPTHPAPTLTAIMTETIDSNFRFLLPTWIGNQPISQDNVVTDHSPALTSYNETLYLVYTNGSGNLSLATTNLDSYRPTANDQTPTWHNLGAFQINGNPLTSSHSPAAVAVNGKVYCFYINSSNHIKVVSYNTANGNVSDLGSMHDGNNNSLVAGDAALAVVFFQGVIYVVYRQSGSANNNLRWAYFDPSNHATVDLGAMKDSHNNQVESELIPALAASPYRMVMVLQQSDSSTDLQWAESSGGNWTLHGDINSLKTNHDTDTPNSSIGFALNFYNDRWYLVYTDTNDSNNYIRLCMMTDADNAWKGNDQVTIYKNDNGNKSYPQTSQAPALGITAGGGMLCYRGNTHDEIFWAYF